MKYLQHHLITDCNQNLNICPFALSPPALTCKLGKEVDLNSKAMTWLARLLPCLLEIVQTGSHLKSQVSIDTSVRQMLRFTSEENDLPKTFSCEADGSDAGRARHGGH